MFWGAMQIPNSQSAPLSNPLRASSAADRQSAAELPLKIGKGSSAAPRLALPSDFEVWGFRELRFWGFKKLRVQDPIRQATFREALIL